jgi:hypothetical protein
MKKRMMEEKMRPQWRLYLLTIGLVLSPLSLPATTQDIGPLVEISRPNAVGSCNTGFNTFGTWPTDEAEEPYVAVNPVHPNNIVAVWIQGPIQDIIAAVSFDGGQNWQRVPIPLTVCSGGSFLGVADPWISFAPDGSLYAVALPSNSLPGSKFADVVMVTKSTDGGLQWSAPSVVPGSDSVDPYADHPSITADPTDTQFVYAIWGGTASGKSGPAIFTRTTDGGLTWEMARAIAQTASQSFIQFSQILVLPNGTLVDIFRYFWIDCPRPPVNPSAHRLHLLKSLLPQPVRHHQRAHAVVTHHDDVLIRVKLLMRTRRDIAHGDRFGALKPGLLVLPRFADVEQCETLAALLQRFDLAGGNFEVHKSVSGVR